MERRSLAPYGLLGGGEGARGINYWYQNWMMEDIEKSLGGKCTVKVGTGDRIVIKTPGGVDLASCCQES